MNARPTWGMFGIWYENLLAGKLDPRYIMCMCIAAHTLQPAQKLMLNFCTPWYSKELCSWYCAFSKSLIIRFHSHRLDSSRNKQSFNSANLILFGRLLHYLPTSLIPDGNLATCLYSCSCLNAINSGIICEYYSYFSSAVTVVTLVEHRRCETMYPAWRPLRLVVGRD